VTCSDIRNMTVPYLELDLEAERVHQVTIHLEMCHACRIEMESVRQVLVNLKGRGVPDPGQRFWSEFPAQIRVGLLQASAAASRPDPRPRPSYGLWGPWWSWAAAASVIILVGAWFLVGGQLLGTSGKNLSKNSSTPKIEAINSGRGSGLPDLGETDWDRAWDEDDPEVLVDIAARLDPLTVDRLFKDI
jgi:hypothetical protein